MSSFYIVGFVGCIYFCFSNIRLWLQSIASFDINDSSTEPNYIDSKLRDSKGHRNGFEEWIRSPDRNMIWNSVFNLHSQTGISLILVVRRSLYDNWVYHWISWMQRVRTTTILSIVHNSRERIVIYFHLFQMSRVLFTILLFSFVCCVDFT